MPSMQHTADAGEAKRLERSRSDRVLAGVSGGLGAYFEIHPAVFRVAFVVLTLMGGAGILVYFVAALVMPDEGKPDSVATAALRERRERPWPLIGLGLVLAAVAALLSEVSLWPEGDAWPFLLVAGAVILLITRFGLGGERAAGDEAAATRPRRGRRWLQGLAIAVASLAVLFLVAVATFLAVFDVDLDEGIAERSYAIASAEELERDYRLGVGELRLDLTSAELPVGETYLDARVDAGALEIVVPEDVAVQARGDAKLGEIRLLGELVDGWRVDAQVAEQGARILVLDAEVGIGAIEVTRAVR